MERKCFICQKTSKKSFDFYQVATTSPESFICKECAHKIGINSNLRAGFHTKTYVLKEYTKINPEFQDLLDIELSNKEKRKEALRADWDNTKAAFSKTIKDEKIRKSSESSVGNIDLSKCKKHKQLKCTCASCGHVFYHTNEDTMKDLGNLLVGTMYTLNQVSSANCPKCNSAAVSRKTVYFWTDKKGNIVKTEE